MTRLSRRSALLALAGLPLAACQTTDGGAILEEIIAATGGGTGGLTSAEAALGIRQALINGTGFAVANLGTVDGYLKDAIVRIALPEDLRKVQSQLRTFGLSGMLDDLEVQINRGAEKAAPIARNIFVDTIQSLTITDAINIVRGPSNAATRFLQARTTDTLTGLFTPVMTDTLQQAGAIQTFDQIVSQLSIIPLAPQLGADAKNDLIRHGVDKGLDGIFHYIGKEEAAIRANPAKRTSEILRKVFG